MKKTKKQVVFTLYVLITVGALTYVSFKFGVSLSPTDYTYLLLYLLMLTIINSNQIKIGNTNITFIFALSLPVFLKYGIVVEAWLIQIILLIGFLTTDSKRTMARIILNQTMFIWMSLISGLVFFKAGGETSFLISQLYNQFIPIFLYAVTYFLVNNIIIYIAQSNITYEKSKLYIKDVAWDGISLLFCLPFGLLFYLTIYVAIDMYGYLPIIIVLSQFILFILLIRYYSQLLISHQQIKTLNQLTTTYTSELNLEKTITALQKAFKDVLLFNYSNIYLMKNNKMSLIASLDSQGKTTFNRSNENYCLLNEKFVEKVTVDKKTLLINSKADTLVFNCEKGCQHGCKSYISAPMIWHDKVIGVVNFASPNEYHFTMDDVNIVNILASQAGLAIRNATVFQKVEEKGLIDELTKIYNFRAFINFLNEMIEEAEIKKSSLSLLMIDLDHFKNINDCYGHQNGNIVLEEIAKLLQRLIRKQDIVARYGGEEFVIIIPDTSYSSAFEIAERIRATIQDLEIVVEDSLNNNKAITVHVTASIGISTYPDMTICPNDLIRFSDRALYIGSKMKGRNRVSVYEGEIESSFS